MTPSPWQRLFRFLVDAKLVVFVLAVLLVVEGVRAAPFDALAFDWLEQDPVAVDAIPDVGENQQIVFTEWPGRSPRDVEDQITYPLTASLMGIPGVRTVRSSSAFGFSTLYVIFEDDVDFYWSRSRVLEKLASLPDDLLPDGVSPTLGPDATGLGQVFWYTLEGRDPDGELAGGWDLDELRAIQDFTVRYALSSVEGVSEVSSVGGFVREYQVDVDPDDLRAQGVTLQQVADAVRMSNLDVGARTMEINRVEYVVRGLGLVASLEDLEEVVVAERDHAPIRLRDVAHVHYGPALRRGGLDDAGAEVVGGIVVARFGANPRAVIEGVRAKIAEISAGMPRRTLEDGTVSQVTIRPFSDRAELVDETVDTLSTALWQQILITLIVVLVMLRSVRSSLLITAILPLGVLFALLVMKAVGVDANIMALGGIAIAIGTMVDMGVVLTENVVQHLEAADPDASRARVVADAAAEVAPAIVTSVLTTVVSFLPVFALTRAEARLFTPLAYTKTFAMLGALVLALGLLPALSHLVLRRRGVRVPGWSDLPERTRGALRFALLAGLVVGTAVLLADDWAPLGPEPGVIGNALFVLVTVALVLGAFLGFEQIYPTLLRTFLRFKAPFLAVPLALLVLGALAWSSLGREYMPPFDEGAYLYMPSTMPHASVGEAQQLVSEMDAAIAAIPEVDRVVGKWGRADSALDPAPVSMIETIITYHPEYGVDEDGHRVRQWRDHIRSPRDIWDEIEAAAQRPGLTGAPMLMPIATRIVMLQSGMRAPMGVEIQGPDLETLERFGRDVEAALRDVPEVRAETVFADRVVGKPYLHVEIDRTAIAHHGLHIADVQRVLGVALGGPPLTTTVEGRERFAVRVRYMREERDSVEALRRVMVPTPNGEVPLEQLATLEYARGPQMIKSQDTFLTSYVIFDRRPDVAEVETVEAARAHLAALVESGELEVPAGVTYRFAGTYEAQVRSEARLWRLVPIALSLVLLLLYLTFRRLSTTLMIYAGVAVAVAGAFILLWLYGQPWFLDFSIAGTSMRALLSVGTVNLSVAAWVGVIALIGIATDDGVVIATYLKSAFAGGPAKDVAEVRAKVLEAGMRRVRPCLMTTATTLLALLPVITSQGRGADVMIPMALPVVGGMTIALITLFVVPVLYCWVEELRSKRHPLEEIPT